MCVDNDDGGGIAALMIMNYLDHGYNTLYEHADDDGQKNYKVVRPINQSKLDSAPWRYELPWYSCGQFSQFFE